MVFLDVHSLFKSTPESINFGSFMIFNNFLVNKFRKWYQYNYKNDEEGLEITYDFHDKFLSYFKKSYNNIAWQISENKVGRNILRSSLIYLRLEKTLLNSHVALIYPLLFFLIVINFFGIIIYESIYNLRKKKYKKNSFNSSEKIDIMFFASYQNYINPMIPVINNCINRGLNVTLLIPEKSIKWQRLNDLNKKTSVCYIEDILKTKKKCNNTLNRLGFFFKILRFGFSLGNLKYFAVWATFIFSSYRLLTELMPKYIAEYFDYNFFLKKTSPKVVIFSRLSNTDEMTLVQAAKKNFVKTIMLPHSYLSPGSEKFFFAGHLKFDSIFTFDNLFLSGFKSNFLVNKKCNVYNVGSVELEQNFFNEIDEINKLKIRKKIASIIGINLTDKWVLYTTASYDYLNFKVIKKNIESILPDNTVLIVKPHPQSKEKYFKLSPHLEQKIKVLPKELNIDVRDLIVCTDVLLTYRSFTNFEAMSLKKPVLTIKLDKNIPNGRAIYQLEKEGFLFSKNSKDLSIKLKKVLSSNKLRNQIILEQTEFIRKIFFMTNKRPSEKISQIIENKINN